LNHKVTQFRASSTTTTQAARSKSSRFRSAPRAKGIKPGEPGWPQEGYNGEYIEDIARDYLADQGNEDDLESIRKFAVAYLRAEQDADLQAFGVKFDAYYLESSLYTEGKVEQVVKSSGRQREDVREGRRLVAAHDRLRRRQGPGGAQVRRQFTYFVPDVAYHLTKWQRGFRKVINVQGTDHHGTVKRVRAGLQALGAGIPKDYPDYVLHSLVKVLRGGQEVKISKRAGSYVTVRDLIDWVGAMRCVFSSSRARPTRNSCSTSTWHYRRTTRIRSTTSRWRTPAFAAWWLSREWIWRGYRGLI